MGELVNLFEVVETKLIHDDGKYAMGLGKNQDGQDILVVVGKGQIDKSVYFNLSESLSNAEAPPQSGDPQT